MNHHVPLVLIALLVILTGCERQKWRLQQREQRRAYYDEQRRKGYLMQDSIYKAQADSLRSSSSSKSR